MTKPLDAYPRAPLLLINTALIGLFPLGTRWVTHTRKAQEREAGVVKYTRNVVGLPLLRATVDGRFGIVWPARGGCQGPIWSRPSLVCGHFPYVQPPRRSAEPRSSQL